MVPRTCWQATRVPCRAPTAQNLHCSAHLRVSTWIRQKNYATVLVRVPLTQQNNALQSRSRAPCMDSTKKKHTTVLVCTNSTQKTRYSAWIVFYNVWLVSWQCMNSVATIAVILCGVHADDDMCHLPVRLRCRLLFFSPEGYRIAILMPNGVKWAKKKKSKKDTLINDYLSLPIFSTHIILLNHGIVTYDACGTSTHGT